MYKDNNYILSQGGSKTRGMAIKRLITRCHSTGGIKALHQSTDLKLKEESLRRQRPGD